MEPDLSKLFVGGISWDTDENRLKDYFQQYGEVVETMIMRDRATGRARGFGFVVFRDPAIAERVLMDNHIIDGRMVEAKRAVPREDQHNVVTRNSSVIPGSPSPGRTKKIFVGGLASTVTESDFKTYFDQFGTVTDVMLMYDQNTQRPRGFGFITYDSLDSVDRVLHKTFHNLNGKMVEVKRAVPKEISPSPARSPSVGYNYGLSRASGVMNNYGQGINLSSITGYGRFRALSSGGRGFPTFANGGYGTGMNMQPGFGASYGGNSSFTNTLDYEHRLGPYYGANSSYYPTPTGRDGSKIRIDPLLSMNAWKFGVSGSLNNPTNQSGADAFLVSGSGNIGGAYENSGARVYRWLSTSRCQGNSPSGIIVENLGYDFIDGNVGLEGGNNRRNSGTSAAVSASQSAAPADGLDTAYWGLYAGGSSYGDLTWRTASSELDGLGSTIGNAGSGVGSITSEAYLGNYSVTNRQPNRGLVDSPFIIS